MIKLELDASSLHLNGLPLHGQRGGEANPRLLAIGEGEVIGDRKLGDGDGGLDVTRLDCHRVARGSHITVRDPNLGVCAVFVERPVCRAEVGDLGEGDQRMVLRPGVEGSVHRALEGVAPAREQCVCRAAWVKWRRGMRVERTAC